jgi:hypothetical protein
VHGGKPPVELERLWRLAVGGEVLDDGHGDPVVDLKGVRASCSCSGVAASSSAWPRGGCTLACCRSRPVSSKKRRRSDPAAACCYLGPPLTEQIRTTAVANKLSLHDGIILAALLCEKGPRRKKTKSSKGDKNRFAGAASSSNI